MSQTSFNKWNMFSNYCFVSENPKIWNKIGNCVLNDSNMNPERHTNGSERHTNALSFNSGPNKYECVPNAFLVCWICGIECHMIRLKNVCFLNAILTNSIIVLSNVVSWGAFRGYNELNRTFKIVRTNRRGLYSIFKAIQRPRPEAPQ